MAILLWTQLNLAARFMNPCQDLPRSWKGGDKDAWRSPFVDSKRRGGCNGEKSALGGNGSSRLSEPGIDGLSAVGP